MSIKVGDIDVVNELIEVHFQLVRTQLLLEEILRNNQNIKPPSVERTNQINEQAISILQSKFPNMGIKKR